MNRYRKPVIEKFRVEALEVLSAESGGCGKPHMNNGCRNNGCSNYMSTGDYCLLGKMWKEKKKS